MLMFGKALVPTDFSEYEKKPFCISPGAELRARKVFFIWETNSAHYHLPLPRFHGNDSMSQTLP
jgi:hypothetical protein